MKIVRTAKQNRDEAMARVEASTSDVWREEAINAFYVVMSQKDTFTTDDVWELLQVRGVEPPHEPRAMGPLVTYLVRNKVISWTGEYCTSRMPQGNARTVKRYTATV